ncbi:putative ABC transport system permease protein [Lutimaribacter pacificus]|uniref:Putative ABC transport system permease protein n=1 Tax=Lutimaribacter pacificus TaxID=391948 RepID=A0A1H0FZ82_9RHOB|nr:ABC transporter permease [Lutimaribacter pacificus]SDN99799.1 putative ABC transport system permease protein [Lutimaribacter pacificus]SHJ83107.1 putative ABC transport system permease protein [Lutimaribacter pacificus]
MVMLHALDRKLVRDLWRLKAQSLAIALVLACGVAIFLTGLGMVRALEATLQDYYSRQHFAHVFASARRAPLSVVQDVAAIDGVQTVEARITGQVILDLPGRVAPASGRVLSLPEGGPVLNVPLLVQGRLPDPDSDTEVAVTDRFAHANGFRPGDRFAAVADGTRLDLTVTGTLRSPEFLYTVPPGGLMPDDEGYGIIWMPERAAAATFGLTGAFNDLSLKLRRDARLPEVIGRVDAILDPWGGTGAHDRELQVSHSFIKAELDQLRSMSVVMPPIFFGIAAFLVNMVLGRIVALERSEIGLLKALGYRDTEIALHYLMLAALVAAIGIGIGWAVGAWLSSGMSRLYARFFDFPWLVQPHDLDVYALAGLIGLTAAALGAIRAAWGAARLAPAVAMAPPAPPSFRRGHMDALAHWLRLPQTAMMVLRGILRWPVRAGMTALGLSLGVAILAASSAMLDSLDVMMESAFFKSNRQHASLSLAQEVGLDAVTDARHLPGVLVAEPQFNLPVTLHNGARSKRLAISARMPGGDLARTLDVEGRHVPLPEKGIMLSDQLADYLGLVPGDQVLVELSGTRSGQFHVPVAGVTTQYIGIGAYMQMDALAAHLREGPRVTTLNLWIDMAQLPELQAALKETPMLATVAMLTDVRNSFQATISETVQIYSVLFITISVLITVGVAYNGARIQLSERARELASLRILGFTRTEVSSILLGETALLALFAQPLGWLIGAWISWAMVAGFQSDLYTIPLVLTPANFASASLITLAAVAAAALLVRRRLDRADLVAVLKTRE